MPTVELQELCEFAKETVAAFFAKEGGIPPIAILQQSDDHVIVVPAPWGNNEEKHLMAAQLRAVVKSLGIVRYIMAGEMWIAPGQFEPDATPPSERPDRKEGIIFYGEESGSAETVAGVFFITRPKTGKPKLSAFELGSGMTRTFSFLGGSLFH